MSTSDQAHDRASRRTLSDYVAARLDRRTLLKAAGAAGLAPLLPGCSGAGTSAGSDSRGMEDISGAS